MRSAGGPSDDGEAHKGGRWVATWAAAPHEPGLLASAVPLSTGLNNQTVRQIVHTSLGGRALRLWVTNRFGRQPVTFDAVRVGIRQKGATLVPGSNRVVTFAGKAAVTIPDGAEVLSDPVALPVGAQQDLAVSLFSAGATGPPTIHFFANQTNFISSAGDFSADSEAGGFTTTATSWYFLEGVEVLASAQVKGAIVALGDSIIDGAGSTQDANRRWTNVLSRRLVAAPHGQLRSVVNAGIIGNNVHESSACFGANALARLERDVLAQTGVSDVILLEGVNDLIHPETPEPRIPCLTKIPISANDLIALYEQIIAQVRRRGLRIHGATITPFEGHPSWTSAMEAERGKINEWMLGSRAFDGVIDFAAALADPQDRNRLARQFDSGDHLHPNDAGHEALGDAAYRALFEGQALSHRNPMSGRPVRTPISLDSREPG